jgi:hypothetical protein
MPPQVRVASEQLGNLPSIQDSFVADTTATAKAVSQIGRDLQNNPAFAAIGNAFEQKEKRNVEDAYMRLQSANNAHLNGGAYTLTDDPLDVDEGGGFLTKRGKHAEGSDEAYRAAMQKDADRLTSKMNANERRMFQKLYTHTTENSLASIRRNTDQEMMRYKSELTDATLQSAASAHLSTAINSYAQQQAFNGGALGMAERQAGATGDSTTLAGAQTAIAQQSQTQAVGAVNEWYNANVVEIDRAADFMRSQGMDEKTIAWRKQEFLQRQGVSMAETLTAQGLYDHADNFLANAEKVGLTDKEAIGKLRMSNERMRLASIEKKNRISDEAYKVMSADIAQVQVKSPYIISERPAEYIAIMQQKAQRTTDPRVLRDIESRIETATAVQARHAEAADKKAKEIGKEKADEETRQYNGPLTLAKMLDKDGKPVDLKSNDIREMATQLYIKGKIDQADFNKHLKTASDLDNEVARKFQQEAVNQIMPVFTDAIKLSDTGFAINPEVDTKGKPKYPFAMASGLKDTIPEAKGFFTTKRKSILLQETVDLMNEIRGRLVADPTYTLEQAKTEFKEATLETTEQAKKLTIMEQIRKTRAAAQEADRQSTTRSLNAR